MLQLRDPAPPTRELLDGQRAFAGCATSTARCSGSTTGPTWPSRAGADGVHLGQDDMPVAEARREIRRELLIGLSTHSPEQLDDGIAAGADQLSVGPVWETPTKPGRPAAGLDYVRQAAAQARRCRGLPSAASTPRTWREVVGGRRRTRRGGAGDPRRRRPARRGRRDARRRSRGAALAQRSSRKRRKERQRAAEAERPAAAQRETTGPRPGGEREPGGAMARGYARGRAKDEAARATLKPLAPGERPLAVTIAGVVALVLGGREPVCLHRRAGDPGRAAGARSASLLFSGLMLAAAWGCFRARYWAVLGMQALLGLTIVIFSLLVVRAENAVASCVIGLA